MNRNELRSRIVELENKLGNLSESEILEYGRDTYNKEVDELEKLKKQLEDIELRNHINQMKTYERRKV